MSHLKNELVDLAEWPELAEVDLVSVLPSYAKARAVVWGSVALGTGLLVAGPLTALAVWGDSTPPWQLWDWRNGGGGRYVGTSYESMMWCTAADGGPARSWPCRFHASNTAKSSKDPLGGGWGTAP
jgi:hypothetical protein